MTPEQEAAIRAAHAWFERNSGWAPPDEESLAEVEKALAGANRIERHHIHEDDEAADEGEDPRLA